MALSVTIAAARDEATAASQRYGDFASSHEAYGVLAEEMAELLDAIRANALLSIGHEALQVAAVALRLSEVCSRGSGTEFARRSGCVR